MELMPNLFVACASVMLVTWYTTDRFQFTLTVVLLLQGDMESNRKSVTRSGDHVDYSTGLLYGENLELMVNMLSTN